MITDFDKYKDIPTIDCVSDDFWKMVKTANWGAVIKGYKDNPIIDKYHRDFLEHAKARVYLKYSYNQIRKFRPEYDIIYFKLYDWFQDDWLDGAFNVGEDGYGDLISSVIGKGKTFVKKCVKNSNLVIDLSEDDNYAENFCYILTDDEEEYTEIKTKYDPLLRDAKKYNF
jgi:hypothetical protein